jgi:radical SAM protein with 4Fe4S-binding SPASM domain
MPMHFDMDEYQKAQDILKEAESMTTERTKIIPKWTAIKDSVNITKYGKWDFEKCISSPFLCQISGNGDCYPCGFLFGDKEYYYGNIIQDNLYDILRSERYWEVLKRLAETPVKEICACQCRHSETLKFLDRITKIYKGDLEKSLRQMCGDNYDNLIDNPPQHRNFL